MPSKFGRSLVLIALLRIHVIGAAAAGKTSSKGSQPVFVRRETVLGAPDQKVVLVPPVLQELEEVTPQVVADPVEDSFEDSLTIPQRDAVSQLPTSNMVIEISAPGDASEIIPSRAPAPPTIVAPPMRAWPSRNSVVGVDINDDFPETIERGSTTLGGGPLGIEFGRASSPLSTHHDSSFHRVPAQFQRRVEQIESKRRVQDEVAKAQRIEADKLARERVETQRRAEQLEIERRAQERVAEAQQAEARKLARERTEVEAQQAETVRRAAAVDESAAEQQAAAESLQAAVMELKIAQHAVEQQLGHGAFDGGAAQANTSHGVARGIGNASAGGDAEDAPGAPKDPDSHEGSAADESEFVEQSKWLSQDKFTNEEKAKLDGILERLGAAVKNGTAMHEQMEKSLHERFDKLRRYFEKAQGGSEASQDENLEDTHDTKMAELLQGMQKHDDELLRQDTQLRDGILKAGALGDGLED